MFKEPMFKEPMFKEAMVGWLTGCWINLIGTPKGERA